MTIMTLNPITRILAGRTAKMVIGILVIVEAVFISESFTTLLEITIRFGGGGGALANLLLFKMPEIVDFGLPIALLIGFYFAIITARDNSELIICAAAGISWHRLPWFALQIGAIGFVISILVSGYIAPLANYTNRMAIAQLYATQITQQLLNPSPNITLQEVGENTLITIASDDNKGAPTGNLFIYHPSKPGTWHISLAQNWRVNQITPDGTFTATLDTFTDYWGRRSTSGSPDGPLSTTSVHKMSIDFKLADILREVDKQRHQNEVLLPALGAMFASEDTRPGPDSGTQTTRQTTNDARAALGEKLARALLCPAAALLALFGAALSRFRFGRLTALPLSLVAVLGFDVVGRDILGSAALAGAVPLGVASLAILVLFLAPVGIFIYFNGEKIIMPLKDAAG